MLFSVILSIFKIIRKKFIFYLNQFSFLTIQNEIMFSLFSVKISLLVKEKTEILKLVLNYLMRKR
ncbi:hypothetical protein BpHYR1_016400 [Brachionus plicatilis]|uniref:Uncharacterized protein n=1 Tax=Brachionus plicatilis TaxID=10195 RepID=A0A3M7SX40_BRAPC|nr:hypothetical protein BpHYR1_016400 [Brachionus plicatilis]